MRRSRMTPERRADIYAAVLDLLRDVGYEAMTMDSVAARTRCSKATLYRQWTGKPEVVARALRHTKPVTLAGIDTGSLRGDLRAAVARADGAQMEKDAALVRGLLHAVHTDPELLQALRELLIDPELTGLHTLLRRAVQRGEIAPDCPALAFVPHMVTGALITRPLIEERAVDQAFLERYIDAAILPALGV
ncbi:TetR/AcrR family transcriptional regulator [Streptomyces sp. KR55]|uniref:TetR/AcrR family transcriptional regulator n=1 Tax=Streptomyces sp. KR55 TaxID=3457425 RepID=UPI003FD1C0C1